MGILSSKFPQGRTAEPFSGTKAQPSCTPFSGQRQDLIFQRTIRDPHGQTNLQRQVAKQGANRRKP